MSVHKRLGNDCPKSIVCKVVDCLCAVGLKSTQRNRRFPAEDDLFHSRIGVQNQWEWREKVRGEAQISLFLFSYLSKDRCILSKGSRWDCSTAFVSVFHTVGMNSVILA